MKEYFTLQEAVTWTSRHSKDDFSSSDILQENEKNIIPIYFRYKGTLGLFSDYSDQASYFFPKPTQRIYFHGTLKSLSTCSLGTITTSMRGGSIKSNILRPHKVEPFETIYSDQDMHTLDMPGTFFGRVRETDDYLDSTTTIPESEWLFHIFDLRILIGFEAPESQQSETPQLPIQDSGQTPVPPAEALVTMPQPAPANGLGWTLRKPKRYQGYGKPLYDVLKTAYTAGLPRPTAVDALDAFKKNKPLGIISVTHDSMDYQDGSGNRVTAKLDAIRVAIGRLTRLVDDSDD